MQYRNIPEYDVVTDRITMCAKPQTQPPDAIPLGHFPIILIVLSTPLQKHPDPIIKLFVFHQ